GDDRSPRPQRRGVRRGASAVLPAVCRGAARARAAPGMEPLRGAPSPRPGRPLKGSPRPHPHEPGARARVDPLARRPLRSSAMRAFIPASWIAVAVALVLLGGCILNKPEEFTEPCTDGIAKHDFGTTDLTTLARVSAFLT